MITNKFAKRGGRHAVLEYLIQHPEGLTSMEAFQMFGVTRLAAIIHDLRDKYYIDTVMMESQTRFNETARYAKYIYRGERDAVH